jgi:putative membrane protein
MLLQTIGWLGPAYPWVKAAHLIFVIFWMAGLFMLPRFLVYHQEAVAGTTEDRTWVHREERLITIILNPAMVAVWALGLALVLNIGAQGEHWFQLKFLLVILLSGYQGWMVAYSRKLAAGKRTASGKTLRLLNEVPGIAAIVIVILVIVKPF